MQHLHPAAQVADQAARARRQPVAPGQGQARADAAADRRPGLGLPPPRAAVGAPRGARRARCWSASTSASRATWPTCRSARCCRRHVSALLMPLRELIGAMDQRDRLPQIELAVGDEVTALVLRHLEPLSEADLQRLRDFGARARRAVVAAAQGPGHACAASTTAGPELAYALAGVRHPPALQADRLHPGQRRRSTACWWRARCACWTCSATSA